MRSPLRHGILRVGAAIRLFLMGLGALLVIVTFTPAVTWIVSCVAVPWISPDRDVLIILGGSTVKNDGLPPGGIVGQNTYLRVIHALYLWRKGSFRQILICGRGGEEAVKPLLIAYGIPESAILVENRSTNTHENAVFAKPILAGLPGKLVLLTSDYHSLRAARCFAHENIPVITVPCPDVFKRANSLQLRWQCFLDLSGELIKIAYYRARGWIS